MSPPTERQQKFVAYLEELARRDDRGPISALRRGLRRDPGDAAEMYPYVVPWLPSRPAPWEEMPYYLVASLYAWHPMSWHPAEGERSDLGASLRALASQGEGSGVERRFVALLNSHPDDLPNHLRRIVGLLKSKQVAVDWAQLLSDLMRWGSDSREVQKRWAASFWGSWNSDERAGPADAEETSADVVDN